jgi:hypothetical protein
MALTMAKEKCRKVHGHNTAVLNRLRALRRSGESYSDAILRLAAVGYASLNHS